MTQSDSIPPVPIGQGSSGQDKSIAATLPYTQKGTPSSLVNDDLLAGVLADLPGVKAHGRDSFRFWCTQEHKKRHAPAWVAVLDGKVRIGCYDDHGHNDDLWRQHVGPNLIRNQSPRDWLAPLAVTGVSRISKGQFDDAIIYGPIWAGPYLLPIEQRELDRRDELAELAGYNLLRGAIADQMGQALPTLSLSQYQDQPTIGQMLRRPVQPSKPAVDLAVGVREPDISSYREVNIAGDGDTFDTIPRRGLYACPNAGRDKARVVQSVRGGSYRVDLACEDSEGDCPACRQHWIDSAAARLVAGLVGDTQLVITATGHQTPEHGQRTITAIGRQLGAVRRCQVLSRTLQYTYAAHIVVTGAMPLPSVLKQITARPGVAVEYRAVSDDDFKALLYSRSRLDGKRCPVRFLHWPKGTPADAAISTYSHNDGYVADAMDAKTIPAMVYTRRRSLKIPESVRVRLRESAAAANADTWLTGIALDLVELLKLRNARRAGVRSKNDWQDSIAAGTYDGPKALIRDLAAALDDDGLVSFTARKAMQRAAAYITED